MKRKPSGVKPVESYDVLKIKYTKNQWNLLAEKRNKAQKIMRKLFISNIRAIIYGSLCRGDVTETSDIDLFIPYQISSFKVETALEQQGFQIFQKKIVQATPKHLIKAHIFLSDDICITFPLTFIREREFEFISFGGSLSYEELSKDKRVPGVDKRLVLIDPTEEGHIESPVVGYESIVAKKVNTSVDLVKERVRILTARDKTGRTGVYLDRELAPQENIDEVFKELKDKDPIVKRRAKK